MTEHSTDKKGRGRVCYTYGVFDLFHYGHLRQLRAAKARGDFLIVGVYTDEVAASFKRPPIMSLADRMEILESIVLVNQVVVQDTFSPLKNIDRYQAHIVAKGEGAGWKDGRAPEDVNAHHTVKAIFLPRTEGISTSYIIAKIKAC